MKEAAKEEWYLSSDGEYYGSDAYGSRDAAINAGWEMYRQVRDGEREWNDLYPDGIDADGMIPPTYYVGKRQDWWPSVDEDYMLDCVVEQADDYAGEFADGWLDVPKEQRELLRSMLQETFDKWIDETGNEPTFFMIEQSEEIDPRDFEIVCQNTDENAAVNACAPTMETAREAAQTPTLALGA